MKYYYHAIFRNIKLSPQEHCILIENDLHNAIIHEAMLLGDITSIAYFPFHGLSDRKIILQINYKKQTLITFYEDCIESSRIVNSWPNNHVTPFITISYINYTSLKDLL